jgi:hypothetical protein
MNKKVFLIGFSSLFFLFYFSCTKEKGKPSSTSGVTQSFCDSLNVKFSTDINPLIQSNCALPGCHNATAAGGVDFTPGYSSIDTSRIRARVLDGNPSFMPPGNPLPTIDRQKIECWLKAGAPNN